jgi:hypothetical protein
MEAALFAQENKFQVENSPPKLSTGFTPVEARLASYPQLLKNANCVRSCTAADRTSLIIPMMMMV